MRRALGLVLITVMLILATFSGIGATGSAIAQEGTPAPGAEQTAGGSNPVVGDTVTFISESGSKIAELALTDVILPWDEYGEYYDPDRGKHYVAFVIEITNFGTRGSLIVRSDDFRLQDVDGFFYSRSLSDAAEGAAIVPTGREIAIGPGETGEMIVVYPVLDGVDLSHLFWQPAFDRLLTIADLDDLEPWQLIGIS